MQINRAKDQRSLDRSICKLQNCPFKRKTKNKVKETRESRSKIAEIYKIYPANYGSRLKLIWFLIQQRVQIPSLSLHAYRSESSNLTDCWHFFSGLIYFKSVNAARTMIKYLAIPFAFKIWNSFRRFKNGRGENFHVSRQKKIVMEGRYYIRYYNDVVTLFITRQCILSFFERNLITR